MYQVLSNIPKEVDEKKDNSKNDKKFRKQKMSEEKWIFLAPKHFY